MPWSALKTTNVNLSVFEMPGNVNCTGKMCFRLPREKEFSEVVETVRVLG